MFMEFSFCIQEDVQFSISFPDDAVHGHGITDISVLTQAQYDALETPEEHTLYVIFPAMGTTSGT